VLARKADVPLVIKQPARWRAAAGRAADLLAEDGLASGDLESGHLAAEILVSVETRAKP